MSPQVRSRLHGVTIIVATLAALLLASCTDNPSGPDPGDPSMTWVWRNPLPQGNDLTSCAGTSDGIGLAVGRDGTILRTTDGGATWTIRASGSPSHLMGVALLPDLTAVAVGYGGVSLRSDDAGLTWSNSGPSGVDDPYDMCFTGAATGTAVGSRGAIARTTDGGRTWVQQDSGGVCDLSTVAFRDSTHGVATPVSYTHLTLPTSDLV